MYVAQDRHHLEGQARDGRVEVSFPAPSHDGEHRSAKREQGAMSEHRDVRVRAGPLGARSAVESSQLDIGETVVPGAMALVTFPERKVTRAAGRRGKRHGCGFAASGDCRHDRLPATGAAGRSL